MSLVSFIKIRQNAFGEAINHSLDAIDYRFPNDIKNIVIKPNLCYYWDYSTGSTTSPAFIGALIEVLRQKIKSNPKISIIESDASAMKCSYVFKILGYEKLSEKHGVDLINLSEDKTDTVQAKAGGCLFRLLVPRIIQTADLRINVPKIKYTAPSARLGITCALKNLYGCNPNPQKYKLHAKLGEAIVAINKAMKFNLCILDGNIVEGVRTSKLGLVMASEDPVAFDAAAARIAGLNPNKLKYLKLSRKEGLGTTSFSERGLPINYFIGNYPKIDSTMKLKSKAIKLLVRAGLGSRLGF
jgi:uncharacterized protein (DUF362 family)